MNERVLTLVTKRKKEKQWVRVSGNMVFHRSTGVYYVRKFRAGKGRLFKSTGETRKGLAQTIADEMMSEWLGGKRLGGRRYRIRELCAALYDELGRVPDRRPKTRRRDYEMFRPEEGTIVHHFGEFWADECDENFWQDWVRTTGGTLGRSLGDIAKSLSKVLTFAFERKLLLRKPRIKNPDPKKKDVQHYTPAQVRMFWRHACQDAQDLITIGVESGMRPHENSGLKKEWVHTYSKKKVEVRIPDDFEKRWSGRNIILSENASRVILRRMKAVPGPYLFPSPKDPNKPLTEAQRSRYWRRAVESANEKLAKEGKPLLPVGRNGGVKFHWLRHTWFTQALMVAGVDIEQAAAYGGNSPKVAFDTYTGKGSELTKDVSRAVNLIR
jgi:integrase